MIVRYVIKRKGSDSYHDGSAFLTDHLNEAKLYIDLDECIKQFNELHSNIDEICTVTISIAVCSEVDYAMPNSRRKNLLP